MSDLVDRLRDPALSGFARDGIAAEAADEIERLRSERDVYSNEITGKLMPEIDRLSDALVITRTTEANLHSEIERLRWAADKMYDRGFLAARITFSEEVGRLRDALEFVLEAASWHFDGNADPLNESPEDMTAHINGLIVKRVREALGHD